MFIMMSSIIVPYNTVTVQRLPLHCILAVAAAVACKSLPNLQIIQDSVRRCAAGHTCTRACVLAPATVGPAVSDFKFLEVPAKAANLKCADHMRMRIMACMTHEV